ncbi:hypothetical protein DEU56DRAFT_912862 [Suillus clintonianus]|uniref:uncharacterized protein n=1 Tax=Suillus clintonianus TaxID=1904413 RepID=UPI001B876562|nr:uncharacterized protein DEU56DRAFT_912862 [Suillus clintonianus]KAG2137089.1 hypothetical protein DEU56DRAFT_912862 [Suillus clintonianus]
MFRERSFLSAQEVTIILKEQEGQHHPPPPEPRASSAGAYYKEGGNEPTPRKRRKAVHPGDNPDYQHPSIKRPPRRNPPRAKANRPESPLVEGADPAPTARETTSDILTSSDLSDCEINILLHCLPMLCHGPSSYLSAPIAPVPVPCQQAPHKFSQLGFSIFLPSQSMVYFKLSSQASPYLNLRTQNRWLVGFSVVFILFAIGFCTSCFGDVSRVYATEDSNAYMITDAWPDVEHVTGEDSIICSMDMGQTWHAFSPHRSLRVHTEMLRPNVPHRKTHNVGIQFRPKGLTTVKDLTSLLLGQVMPQSQQPGKSHNVSIYLDFVTLRCPGWKQSIAPYCCGLPSGGTRIAIQNNVNCHLQARGLPSGARTSAQVLQSYLGDGPR